jgi:hypothetical protein
LEDVEEACRMHSPSLVINIDETSVRTVRPPRTAVARKGWDRGRRPVLTVTRSDRESTSLVCAVAANGHLLQPCVLRGKRGEAALSKDSRWVTIQSGGWTNEAAYIEYVWRVILPYTRWVSLRIREPAPNRSCHPWVSSEALHSALDEEPPPSLALCTCAISRVIVRVRSPTLL